MKAAPSSTKRKKARCRISFHVSPRLNIPIITGGGVETKDDARNFVEAGADIVVMGTFIENNVLKDNGNSLKVIIDEIKDTGKTQNKNYSIK